MNTSTGNRLRAIAADVWIVEDTLEIARGTHIPVRMSVIRLPDGNLILHSPTRYTRELRSQLEELGSIRYLVAPNTAHWVFIPQWQREVTESRTYAVPNLATRRSARKAGLRVDHELSPEVPAEWSATIEMVLISAAGFCETAFFHTPSRTLILTDLVLNVRPETLSSNLRTPAKLLGVTTPDGHAPFYLRLLLRLGGRSAQLAAARLVALAPQRVIFAHGECFEADATEKLRRALGWLTQETKVAKSGRDLAGTRVVITGASSGIGWAAALTLAQRGASLVLAARRESVLEKLAEECRTLGGRALAVRTDVTDPDSVAELVREADAKLGGIDVWINNAGIGVVGEFHETDLLLHRRTLEVNLFGALHAAHAVIPVFLRQRRGILINNISMAAWAPTPFAAAYVASKFALRGFTASLRQELQNMPDIHVCGVFPAMIDTPGFSHGANQTGRHLNPGPILYQAEDVAATFLALIRKPQAEVAVGWPSRAGQLAYSLAPSLTEKIAGALVRRLLSRAQPAENTEGAMLEPIAVGTTGPGGWLARSGLPPAGQLTRIAATIAVTAIALVSIVHWRRISGARGRTR